MSATFTDIEAERVIAGWLVAGHELEAIRNHSPDIVAEWFDTLAPIYRAACEIEKKEAVNGMALTDHLERTGQLGQVGGPSALAPVDSVIIRGEASEAILGQCLDKLRKLYGKKCVAALAADMARGMAPAEAIKLLEMLPPEQAGGRLKNRRFDILNPPPKAVPVLSLAGQGICTAGNLVALTGQAKAGKSAVIAAIITTQLDGKEHLGMLGGNPKGRAVIHFDTEQSRYDHHQLVRRALHRAGVKEAPEWLRSYTLADVPTNERRAALIAEMSAARSDHGGIALVIVDGVADFCNDPNDPAEAFGLVEELHRMAIRFDCPILLVLHLNPGTLTAKSRGHLGSQLERKAEAVIMLEKEGDAVSVWLANARHGYLPKGQGPRFGWDDESGQFETIAGTRKEAISKAKAEDQQRELLRLAELVKRNGPRKREQFIKDIEDLENVSRATAERRFQKMKDTSIVHQDLSGAWELVA